MGVGDLLVPKYVLDLSDMKMFALTLFTSRCNLLTGNYRLSNMISCSYKFEEHVECSSLIILENPFVETKRRKIIGKLSVAVLLKVT